MSCRSTSVRLCALLTLVTGSAALMYFVPAHVSDEVLSNVNATLETGRHLHCEALNPDMGIFKRRATDNSLANASEPALNSRSKRQTTAQPIRITTVYDSSFSALTKSAYLKQLVEQAVGIFRKSLLVRRPAVEPIAISRTCKVYTCSGTCPYDCYAPVTCQGVAWPQKYLETCKVCSSSGEVTGTLGGPGASNTDFLLLISATLAKCSSDTVAFASACNVDSYTWRPVAGMLNLCKVTTFTGDLVFDPNSTVNVIAHEITHALGFSKTLFPFYIDDNGSGLSPLNPRTGLPYLDSAGKYVWGDRVAVTKNVYWQTASGSELMAKTYIVTPTVVQFVRQFFNCDSLIGGELEDQGGSGTILSHWEKRIFVNEYMAGVFSEQMYVSALTLSLLQDTGWYYAVFSAAETYTWGQGLGCSFASESCLTWINAKVAAGENPYPFCNSFDMRSNGETRTTCDPEQQSVRACNLAVYEWLNSNHRYFSKPLANAPSSASPSDYGGLIYHADYCPYYEELYVAYPNDQVLFSTCNNYNYNPPLTSNYGLETYGPNSICLRQASPNYFYQCSKSGRSKRWGSGCYSVICSGTSVTVTVNGQVLTCTSEQQTISWTPTVANLNVSTFKYTPTLVTGTIVCPRCDNACPNRYCPMQRVPANSTTLLDTYQTSSSSLIPANISSNIPCYAASMSPKWTFCYWHLVHMQIIFLLTLTQY